MRNFVYSKTNLFGILILFFATLFLIYNLYFILAESSDNVKAASIAALVSISVYVVGRLTEQQRELRSKQNQEKIIIYKKFLDFYFNMFSSEKLGGKKINDKEIMRGLFEFQRDVVFWGSDAVINKYLDLKEEWARFSLESHSNEERGREKSLARVFELLAELISEMRRDIGYQFTSFSARELARLQLSNDTETRRIMEFFSK